MIPVLLPGEIIVDSFAGVSRGFKLRHARLQLGIVCRTIDPEVHAPMAIRTQRYDVRRVIWAAVAHAAKMVGLEVCGAIWSAERSFLLTAFTIITSARQDIASYVAASSDYASQCIVSRQVTICRSDCSVPKFCKIGIRQFLFIYFDYRIYSVQWTQLKRESIAFCVVRIAAPLHAKARTNPVAFESEHTLPELSEKQEIFAVARMISDRGIALVHGHVAGLPLANVFEDPILTKGVHVSVLATNLAGDEDDNWISRRCDDAALLLTAVGRMNVFAPVVNPSSFEWPLHHCRRSPRVDLADQLRLCDLCPTRSNMTLHATASLLRAAA